MLRVRQVVLAGWIPLLLLSGCFKTPSILSVKNDGVTVRNDSILQASLVVSIRNNNAYPIRIRDLNYVVTVTGDTVSMGAIKDKIILKKKNETSVRINPEVNFNRAASLPDSLFNCDSIPVQFNLSGRFTVLSLKKNRSIVMYVKWREVLDEFLSRSNLSGVLIIKNIGLKSLTLAKSEMNVDFEFNNFLPLQFSLDSFIVNVSGDPKGENIVGGWKSVKLKEIPPRSREDIPAVVMVKNLNMLQSALKKLLTGDLAYYLDGKAYIRVLGRKFTVPVNHKMTMPGPGKY